MTGTSLSEDWIALAEVLATPGEPSDTSVYEDLVLADAGYRQEDGIWRARVHALTVRLHPYGIGNLRSPHGAAHCSCDWWSEWNWRDARTPRLLTYGQLAAWIAGHAEQVGATQVAEQMASIEVLLALAED